MKKNFLSSMSVTVHMEILSLLFSSLTRKIHVIPFLSHVKYCSGLVKFILADCEAGKFGGKPILKKT